ncbi:DUF1731 domain-containing protein [Streptomyces sp. 2A115]|uniref:DUF1731 domain-containing protein n=1 Tax=Streptomyces sp. 2A115 TaxID=3457439 RepID=UPI003FD2F595
MRPAPPCGPSTAEESRARHAERHRVGLRRRAPPAFAALRVALGEFASGITGSCRSVPTGLPREGFTFRHPTIDETLKQFLRCGRRRCDQALPPRRVCPRPRPPF